LCVAGAAAGVAAGFLHFHLPFTLVGTFGALQCSEAGGWLLSVVAAGAGVVDEDVVAAGVAVVEAAGVVAAAKATEPNMTAAAAAPARMSFI
jgi:hypothetical protein